MSTAVKLFSTVFHIIANLDGASRAGSAEKLTVDKNAFAFMLLA